MKELNKNEIYSLEELSDEQLGVLLLWLKENDKSWERLDIDYFWTGLRFNFDKNTWITYNYWDINSCSAKATDLFEDKETPSQLFSITSDKVVQSVMNDLNERSRIGVEKYNTTLERTDLSLKDWLQHAYEETLDKANYLKRAILELENK